MRKMIFTVLAFAGTVFTAMSGNTWNFDVEANTDQIQTYQREFARGETWNIAPRVLDDGVPRAWPSNTTFAFFWQKPNMLTNWWASTNGTFPVYNGSAISTGRASMVWNGATMDVGANQYNWFIRGVDGVGTSYRVSGTISMKGSPGAGVTFAGDPVSWTFATTSFVNSAVAAEAAIRSNADVAINLRVDNLIVGAGLNTQDVLNVIASVVPTSRVAYAESAGTAGVATVALGGWPVQSVNGQTGAVVIATNAAFSGPYVATVNGQTGNVTVAASLPAGAIVATNQGVAGQSFFFSQGAPAGVSTGYFATASGSGDMLKSEYDAGGVKQVAFTNDQRIVLALTNPAQFATAEQGATQEAFRVASTVNFATNSGNAATVGGYTATQLLSQAGVIYYVWGSLAGPFTGVPTKMAQLSSPHTIGVWTSTVASVTNLMSLGYVSINTNELSRFTVPGREIAHISIERTGNSQERTMRVCKSVYESNQVTLVSHICGDAKAVPQGKSHLDFDLFETTETAITDNRRYIVYSFTTVSGWGGETINVYSQDGELTYISTAGGAGVYASQSSLDAHTIRTNNPHDTTASQVGALSTNGGRMLAGIFSDVDYLAAAPASDELPTAEWVRSLQSSGKTIYMTTNLYATSWTPTNTTGVGSYDTQSATTMVFTVGTAGTYIATMVDTNIVAAGVPLTGPATVHIHLTIGSGSPSANYSLSVKPELYYTYSLTTNQLTLGDFDADPQTWTIGQSVGKTFALAWPTVTPSAPYYRVYRLKVTAKGSAINTVTMGVGGTDASYVTFQTTGEDASAVAADLVTHEALSKHATFAVADIAAAGGMTNGQPITAAQLPAVALTNGGPVAVAATNAQYVATNHVAQVGTAAHAEMPTNNGSYAFTLTGGNAITNGAIPGPGCKDFGASRNLTLDGLTSAYAGRPDGVYTINVSRAAAAGYCYVLTTYSTNAYVLGSNLVQFGTHTIGATNRFGFSPDTNGTYQVPQMRVQ